MAQIRGKNKEELASAMCDNFQRLFLENVERKGL
jgi:hypothetical protein